MADLVAKAIATNERWRRPLPKQPVTLGRREELCDLAVPWDRQISGRHAELRWVDNRLHVRRLPSGKNKIYIGGRPLDHFTVAAGEPFIIGGTSFVVMEVPQAVEMPAPQTEMTCAAEELRRYPYVDASQRIEVLAALPAVIRLSRTEAELEQEVLAVLLRGIARAEVAATVRLAPTADAAPEVSRVEFRNVIGGEFQPSQRLIVDALERRRQSILHIWEPGALHPDYTAPTEHDWALCTPLPDDPLPGWGLYVAGQLSHPLVEDPAGEKLLKSDLKFAELVSDMFGSLRQVRDLQRRQGQLLRFLSRPVLAALAGRDMDEVLKPRQATVTVLFCDLRGSCRIAEETQAGLMTLWNHVNAALSIMSHSILEQDGVIGDFQGDAAMGFWGWPLDSSDQIERAARAALAIHERFTANSGVPDHPLAGFACGLGLAHGPGLAGRLGTADQFKIDVFGPVVNLASRLESLTKQLGVPILMDEDCAQRLAEEANHSWVRCRRVARVQPFGMQRVVTVSELLPPAVFVPERTSAYEAGLAAFQAGRWSEARVLLRSLPEDRPADFLTTFMDKHSDSLPPKWDGTIIMDAK
jgi:adenylate cyclase